MRDDLRGLVIPAQLEQDQGEPLSDSHVRGIGHQSLSPGRQRGLVLVLGVFDHSLHREDAGIVARYLGDLVEPEVWLERTPGARPHRVLGGRQDEHEIPRV